MTPSPDTGTNPPHLYHSTPLTYHVYEDKTTVPTPPFPVHFLLLPFNRGVLDNIVTKENLLNAVLKDLK